MGTSDELGRGLARHRAIVARGPEYGGRPRGGRTPLAVRAEAPRNWRHTYRAGRMGTVPGRAPAHPEPGPGQIPGNVTGVLWALGSASRPPCSPASARPAGTRGCAAGVRQARVSVQCARRAGHTQPAPRLPAAACRMPAAPAMAAACFPAVTPARAPVPRAPLPRGRPARGCSSGCSSPGSRGGQASTHAQARTLPDSPGL